MNQVGAGKAEGEIRGWGARPGEFLGDDVQKGGGAVRCRGQLVARACVSPLQVVPLGGNTTGCRDEGV